MSRVLSMLKCLIIRASLRVAAAIVFWKSAQLDFYVITRWFL